MKIRDRLSEWLLLFIHDAQRSTIAFKEMAAQAGDAAQAIHELGVELETLHGQRSRAGN